MARTIAQKIWDNHLVRAETPLTPAVLYIDLHLVHEVTTPQAFAGLRANGRKVRRPDRTLAVADHNIPTDGQAKGVDAVEDAEARLQLQTLARNVADNGIEFFPMGDIRNGIVDKVPVGRLGKPGEIARTVAFLTDDEAGFITGAFYPIDGGYTAP